MKSRYDTKLAPKNRIGKLNVSNQKNFPRPTTRLFAAITVSLSITIISTGALATQVYKYHSLSLAGAIEGEAMAIGGDNLIAGSAYLQGNSSRSAIVWSTDGTATVLPGLNGGARTFGASTNGIVVGYGSTTIQALRGISWIGGVANELTTLGGSTSGAYDVNSNGVIVGFSDLVGNSKQHATMWTNGSPVDLGSLGGDNSVAYGINETGQIAGYSSTSTPGVQRATLWTTTGRLDLGTLGGTSSFSFDINDAQQVVGWSYLFGNGGESRATLWDQGQIINLGSLGGSQSFAVAINSSGTAVGASLLPGNSREHAVMYRDSKVIDLNIYLSAERSAEGWYITQARDISDAGAIVGWSLNSITGEKQAFLLSPVPELPSIILLITGLYGILLGRRAQS